MVSMPDMMSMQQQPMQMGMDMGQQINPMSLLQMLMGANTPSQRPQPAQTGLSPLDMWARSNYGVTADQLDPTQMDELIDHIVTLAENDKDFWKPRDDRMLDSQMFWELGSRYANSLRQDIEHKQSGADNPEEQSSEQVEFNDGYLTVDKITSMVEGAGWGFDVQPKMPEMDDVAQNIENALRWADDELNKVHGLSLHSTINRDEIHYAVLRGWITGMILPNPKSRVLPWKYVLEDPLFVYPRYSSDGLIRVTHQYTMLGLEAKSEFPSAAEYLDDREDDEEIQVIDYYDDIYRMTILSGTGATGSAYAKSAPRYILQPLTRHGYINLNGEPINPWIIVTPRGSPTRRIGRFRSVEDQKRLVAYIGLDVLHPMKDMLVTLEKLASMQFTEIAKGVNPAMLVYYDGHNKPEPIDSGIGMQNYLVFQAEDAKVLDTTSMKPDAGPFLSLVSDRLQRSTVPSVLYGQAGFSLAGYAINLLSQGANDIVRPLLNGIKLYRELKYTRMLEMYANVASQWMPQMGFPYYDKERDITYASGAVLTPDAIMKNGTNVKVSFDEVMPRDTMQLIPTMVGALQAGLLPIYDAMKQIGIKDPRQALRRLAESKNFEDPLVMKHMARLAGASSGNDLLKAAIMAAQQEEAAIMQQQMLMAGMQAGGEAAAAGSKANPMPQQAGGGQRGRNTEESPPASVNPLTAAVNQQEAVTAENNVENGASQPSGDTVRRRARQVRRG